MKWADDDHEDARAAIEDACAASLAAEKKLADDARRDAGAASVAIFAAIAMVAALF